MSESIRCGYCGDPAELVTGAVIYPHRPDLTALLFWQCAPCDAYVGCHGDSARPKGALANAPLRAARIRAHAAFDPWWQSKGSRRRNAAYRWLADTLGIDREHCHIGLFDEAMCARVVALMAEYAESVTV